MRNSFLKTSAIHRIILIIPDLFSDQDGALFDLAQFPQLQYLAQSSKLFKIAPLRDLKVPESAYLGLDPSKAPLEQGPLTVAALGMDPPPGSVHFHLSLLSLGEEGDIQHPEYLPSKEFMLWLSDVAGKLKTRSLTALLGEDFDHGLVLEKGSIELQTIPARDVVGKPYAQNLPVGERESVLRTFIDDSVNILSELEENQRRVDQGMAPLNLLWPWGHGFRVPLPNLPLQRGEPAWVESSSLRIQGLSHLVRYKHGDRNVFGRGLNLNFETLLDKMLSLSPIFVIIEKCSYLRTKNRVKEITWLLKQLEEHWLSAILERTLTQPMQLSFLCPFLSGMGLGFIFNSEHSVSSHFPFDERLFEEKRLPVKQLWEIVREGLECSIFR